MRGWWVRLHRWIGLATAGFLIVVGLTGAMLAWYAELDTFFASDLRRVSAHGPDAKPLDPFELREIVAADHPEIELNSVNLEPQESLAAIRFSFDGPADPLVGQPYSEFWVDPITGATNGYRQYADLSQGRKNLIPFLMQIHTSLAIPVGGTLLGIVALFWTLDCFLGAYLTFPRGRPFLAKWMKSWRIKRSRLNFDLHRAGGLWFWGVLLLFAWSSVYFNLTSVYLPITKTLFGLREDMPTPERVAPRHPQATPGLTWRDAYAAGRELAPEVLARSGLRQVTQRTLGYDPERATFSYSIGVANVDALLDGSRDLTIVFDANSGTLLETHLQPEELLGDTITWWIGALHVAGVWGLPLQIVVCVTGLLIAILSVTGVVIWWRKGRTR